MNLALFLPLLAMSHRVEQNTFFKPFLLAFKVFSRFSSNLCNFSLLFSSSGLYSSFWSLNISILQVLIFGRILYKLSSNKLIQVYSFNYCVQITYLLIYASLAQTAYLYSKPICLTAYWISFSMSKRPDFRLNGSENKLTIFSPKCGLLQGFFSLSKYPHIHLVIQTKNLDIILDNCFTFIAPKTKFCQVHLLNFSTAHLLFSNSFTATLVQAPNICLTSCKADCFPTVKIKTELLT